MSVDDPYVYPGTDVLKNKFYLRNDRSLGRRERIESSLALKQLGQSPVTGAFDLAHYKDVHRRLFDKVYDWAGEVRTVDLTKPEIALQGRNVPYSPVDRIGADAARALGLMAGPWGDLKNRPEAARFAVVVAELWRAHPFREGNTRTVLAFVEQFTRKHDIRLDMAVINRVPSETRDALALATTGHIAPLVRLIVEARRSELQRTHPELGRLTSEAVEVVSLLGNPRIVVPAVGQEVRGQILTTSYDHVLVRHAGAIAAVPLRAFTTPPSNDAHIAVTVQPPGMPPAPVPAPVQVPQRQLEAVLAERLGPTPLDVSVPTPQRQPEFLIPPKIAPPFPAEAIDEYLAGNSSARRARAEAVAVAANVFISPEAIVRTFEREIARGITVDPAAFANEPMRGAVTWRGNDRERTAALRQLPAVTDTLRRLESALRAAMAAQRADLERQAHRDRIPIPAPSTRLAEALATAVETRSVHHVLADPEMMTEVKGLTAALHARFEHEDTAVLTRGRPDDAAALLPEGASLEAVRAVLEPLRAVVMAEQEQAQTLTRENTLAPEPPTLGAAR